MERYVAGVHLQRSEGNDAGIDALASLVGGRVGLRGVLGDLNRRGRDVRTRPFWPPGRAVHRAFTWDLEDRRTTRWWPQGISTSADASATELVEGRRMLAVTWYSKDLGEGGQGSRVTFVDRETRRYRHVLLVVPRVARDGSLQVRPLRVHAGGVVWCGDHLHVAATSRGFMTFRLDDLVRIPGHDPGGSDRIGVAGERVSAYGYRYLLPLRFSYRSLADEGHEKLRYSFLSLDRSASPPHLVAGEYASREQRSRRLVHFPLDPESLLPQAGEDGIARPLRLEEGVAHMQGVAVAGGSYYLSVSTGRTRPGSVHVGGPGAFRAFPLATPMGPEDLVVVAVDRRAVVGHRASLAALGVQHGAPLVRPLIAPGQQGAGSDRAGLAGQLTALRDQPPGGVPDLAVLLEHPARHVAGRVPDLQPARRRVGADVGGELQRRRPAGHPEVEGHRREGVDGEQQRERVRLASVVEPEPCLQDAVAARLPDRPADVGRVEAHVEAVHQGRDPAYLLRRHGVGHAVLGRRQERLLADVRTSSGRSPRSPYVASVVILVRSPWTRSAATVATVRPSRSVRVATVAGPGSEAGQVVGADRDRVGLGRKAGPDCVADDRQQVAAVDAVADHPAGSEFDLVLARRGRLDRDLLVELAPHSHVFASFAEGWPVCMPIPSSDPPRG